MTTLREAAQQALEALEFLSLDFMMLDLISPGREAGYKAITALRAALVEQARPVAWQGYDLDAMCEAFQRLIDAHYNLRSPFHQPVCADAGMALRILRGFVPTMKAYTTPPAPVVPQPLTVERLRAALVASRIIDPGAVEDPDNYDDGVTLARIEALYRRIA